MTTIQILALLSQKGFIDLDPSKEIPKKLLLLENVGHVTLFRVEEYAAMGVTITDEGRTYLRSLKSHP